MWGGLALRRARPARGCEGEVELRSEAAEGETDQLGSSICFSPNLIFSKRQLMCLHNSFVFRRTALQLESDWPLRLRRSFTEDDEEQKKKERKKKRTDEGDWFLLCTASGARAEQRGRCS